ncbi:predicted protein [Histoplasma mississippiense (nom. inval.)]|uniref:predicted protein n=1 Tax=Ajellomyces capsulatus (strain NAm1 / WU24) TaxID=2059318 RepID=UPI000157BD5B|nr:predicted protein [Histoplasma mississippiense (nom. inval.)]EDN05937.1 predicted protein [Histoplasma mississippiense (nom. inval.)]
MGTSTYDITSPGPADGSLSTQLDTAHLLEVYTPDPWSNEEPLHLLPIPMPMPMPLFSAPVHLSKDAASETFANFSALPSTVSGLDDINWDEWILFNPSPVDVPPPSLQLSDFSDDPIEEAHPSPSDVADDPPSRQEPTPPLAFDYREGNTSKGPLNDSNSPIKADPHPGEERHIQAHRSEEVTPPASDHWEGDAWRETLDKQEYIILLLSQVTIQALVSKRNGHEVYKIVGRMDLQQARGYGTQEKQWNSGSAGVITCGRAPGQLVPNTLFLPTIDFVRLVPSIFCSAPDLEP